MKPIFAILGIAAASAAYAGSFPASQTTSTVVAADSVEEADSAISIESVSDFFLFSDEFPTIDPSVRMDMLDYYASGIRKQMPSRLGDTVMIDSIAGDHYMKVTTSESSETEIQMYTDSHGDKFFGVINRVMLPATDSRISFRLTHGSGDQHVKLIAEPAVEDFLTTKDKNVINGIKTRIDFPLIDYRFLPDGDVTARLTAGGFLSREDSAAVMPFVNSGIIFHWDGKKFKQKK